MSAPEAFSDATIIEGLLILATSPVLQRVIQRRIDRDARGVDDGEPLVQMRDFDEAENVEVFDALIEIGRLDWARRPVREDPNIN